MKRIGKVLAVVALAVGVLTPLMLGPTTSPLTGTRMLLYNVSVACSVYMAEIGEPPASLSDLVQNRKGIVFIYWGKSGANDGWGNPIRFKPYDDSLGYGSVISYGRDGRPGGKGRDADVEVRFGERRR